MPWFENTVHSIKLHYLCTVKSKPQYLLKLMGKTDRFETSKMLSLSREQINDGEKRDCYV